MQNTLDSNREVPAGTATAAMATKNYFLKLRDIVNFLFYYDIPVDLFVSLFLLAGLESGPLLSIVTCGFVQKC